MKKSVAISLIVLGMTTSIFASGMVQGDYGYQDMGRDGKHRAMVHHKKHGGMKKDRLLRVLNQLDLSRKQRISLNRLRESAKAERQKMRQERMSRKQQGTRPDLSRVMTAQRFDKEAFKAEVTRAAEARKALKKQRRELMLERRAEYMEKVFEILTPQQRIKWIELSNMQ